MALDRSPPNPDYGTGTYRRRMTFDGTADTVAAELFDDYHHMRCRLEHDGARVSAITGEMLRFPFSTCGSAGLALDELVGMPLDRGADIYGEGRPQRNCTHLFDLAALAIDFAPALGRRTIEIAVKDAGPDRAEVRASIDDQVIHDWWIANETIVRPYADRSLFGGFVPWARGIFDGSELQAALAIQKAVMVARGRRYLVDQRGGGLTDEPERIGSCYSFTEPRFSAARRLSGYARDLRDGFPEELS